MAKITLADVVDAQYATADHIAETFDTRFGEFMDQLAADQQQARLDAAEARAEAARSATGPEGLEAAGEAAGDVEFGDPVVASKESGMILAAGKAFGVGGIGIGAAAAGIGYLVSQILDLGPAMTRMSQGLEDLDNTEVSAENFRKIGGAISDLVSGAGIGGALGIRILAGTAFNDLATGIERLNAVSFDPAALQAVGEGLDGMLAPLSGFDLGEAGVLQMIDDNLMDMAAGVDALAKAEVPTEDKMRTIGEGLNAILEPLSAGDVGEATVFQMIDDNMETLANGLLKLQQVDPSAIERLGPVVGYALQSILDGTDDLAGASGLQMIDDNLIPLADAINYLNTVDDQRFLQVAGFVGPAFQRLLDGTDDLFGATGMQMIDDNLMPLADGIRYVTDTITREVAQQFTDLSYFIGPAFQRMLDGTDDLLGATGLQMIDDNLKPMADGIKYMSDVGAEVNFKNVGNIVDAYNELGRMGDVSPTKIQALADMLSAVASPNSVKTDAIEANTDPTGGGGVTVVNNNVNAPVSSSTQNNASYAGNSTGSPTVNTGTRADAYSAA